MLHDNVRHFAGLFASAGQEHAGRAVRAPMLAAAIAINPTITRLMHVFLGRKRLRGTGSRIVFDVRFLIGSRHIPQIGPFHAELGGQTARQRKAQADNAVRIAFDGVDECSAEALKREGTSHFQRFSGGDVPFDIGVGIFAEVQRCPARASRDTPGGEVDQAMARPQFTGGATHGTQSFPSHLSAMRLAVTFAVKQEHGIAAKNQRTDFRTGQARLAINEISNRFGDRRNGDSRKIAGLHIGGGLHFVRTQRNTMMF